jgi:hypothetical protein
MLNRRRALAGLVATLASARSAAVQSPDAAASQIYFVPGGRTGFRRPADMKPLSHSWRLLSRDQTLRIEVREALRIDATWDARMWEQDDQNALVASFDYMPGVEHRHFTDLRYQGSADYAADTLVFRDDSWIGQIKVSVSTLGSRFLSVPGGQIEHWRAVVAAWYDSIRIRPLLPVPEALAELGVRLTLDGLHPRLAGDQLILSLAPPATRLEAAGADGSYILVADLGIIALGTREDREAATNLAFDIYRKLPGGRVIEGAPCRGVVLAERKPSDVFATTLMAFGRTRSLKLTAFYDDADRAPILQALERVFGSLSLPDDQ